MPAEVRNGRRRRDQLAKSPMRCSSLRQAFCSFTASFPQCSVARVPAATLGAFTAAYLPLFPLTQPPSPDPTKQTTCLYQLFSSHSFIPVQTPCTSAHYPLRSPRPVLSTTFSIFFVFSQVVCICCAPYFPTPPHADYVISWFVDIPDDSKNMLRLYFIRSILSLTYPSAPRYLPLRSPHVPDVVQSGYCLCVLLNKWKVPIPLAVYY
ncbi:uncharacterized protein SCHCODRAFT_02232154 [Schizophyllum commune H4-8]|uniref:uncharacterized protein n=1 Tax=Schizophyllum commune (strain H4-8 / FGSC 9210) TaxID=578458 RepID=UPI00215FD11A|nr:uncharacterized protein SCHCODRAFT_02232154 [Schizophyllum commune H4-8]KAI5895463.1 hypothetical protein SCHCODRAFT_02232154 [Schizophyllum commune H4-8]